MVHPLRLPQPVSPDKRERDIFKLYGSAFRDMVQLAVSSETCSLPSSHVPPLSKDSALTAFAQLASIRLGAQRAMISLIDDKQQHILSEATPDLSLRPGSSEKGSDVLWLGRVSIPRTWGVCEQVLRIDPTAFQAVEDAIVVIGNLAHHEKYAERKFVTDGPKVRFYAGTALTSPAGAIVGSLSVFDEKPRGRLPKKDILYLQNLAATIVEYLDTYTLKEQLERGEQMTRGLVSFARGRDAFEPAESHIQRSVKSSDISSLCEEPEPDTPITSQSRNDPLYLQPPLQQRTSSPDPVDTPSTRHTSVEALQECILPANSRPMFARAARVLRTSSALDGVLILDASIANTSSRNYDRKERVCEGSGQSAAEPSLSSSSSSEEIDPTRHGVSYQPSRKFCQVLGSSTIDERGTNKDYRLKSYRSFMEKDLARMLHNFPNGKILYFTANGEAMSSSDDSEFPSTGESDREILMGPLQSRKSFGRVREISRIIQSALPGVRSVAFMPLWDYERSRWFAGCHCWSNSETRLLSANMDLPYLKVFGNSIMTELSRLDAIASEQTKTTFAASISHELRSPLHGILGTLEFLKETSLDSFQISMLNSLGACGQTLLDTINHVLDHSKLSSEKNSLLRREP